MYTEMYAATPTVCHSFCFDFTTNGVWRFTKGRYFQVLRMNESASSCIKFNPFLILCLFAQNMPAVKNALLCILNTIWTVVSEGTVRKPWSTYNKQITITLAISVNKTVFWVHYICREGQKLVQSTLTHYVDISIIIYSTLYNTYKRIYHFIRI